MLTGLILAGGPNTRMNGDPKALLPFRGEALIKRQVKAMREACEEVIVVTGEPAPLLRLLDRDTRIITDYYASKGPLAGMHAGFSLAKSREIWVAGCDMPFLSSKAAALLLNALKKGYEAAIPQLNGNLYVLHGVYDKACAQKIPALLERGEADPKALLQELIWLGVRQSAFVRHGVDPRFITSIETRKDYEQFLHYEIQQSVREIKND